MLEQGKIGLEYFEHSAAEGSQVSEPIRHHPTLGDMRWNSARYRWETNLNLLGQYIVEVTATSTDSKTDLVLEVDERLVTIYSAPLKGVGTLVYKKKD